MGAGYHGGFGKTKGESLHKKIIHIDRQNKHIVGNKNYVEGKSIFLGTIKDAAELIREYSGKGQLIGNGKERVDFEKIIGIYIDKETGKRYPTTMGIIHSSKHGSHIVPARPKYFKGE